MVQKVASDNLLQYGSTVIVLVGGSIGTKTTVNSKHRRLHVQHILFCTQLPVSYSHDDDLQVSDFRSRCLRRITLADDAGMIQCERVAPVDAGA